MHNYLGELAALGTSFSWSFGSMFFTISSRRIGSNVVNPVRKLERGIKLALVVKFVEVSCPPKWWGFLTGSIV